MLLKIMKDEFHRSFKNYKLDNGLVVALQNTPTRTVAGELRMHYGVLDEREDEKGLSHFLEHWLCNGGSKKLKEDEEEYFRDSIGELGAYTTVARVFFVAGMLPEDLENWLKYVSSSLFNPKFSKKVFEGEKKRVLRELGDKKSNDRFKGLNELDSLFYKDHPRGVSIVGGEEIVKNVDLEKLISFYKRGYYPNNADLILVGGIPKNIESLIEKNFGSFSPGRNTRKTFPPIEPLKKKEIIHVPCKSRINEDNPENSSAEIVIKYNGPVSWEKDDYSTKVMNQIFGGGGRYSRLINRLGLEEGLAYEINSFGSCVYNAAEMGVRAVVPAKNIGSAIKIIFEEMDRMKTEKVNKRKIEAVRKKIRYNQIKESESPVGNLAVIESYLDEGITSEKVLEGFDKVTPESVLEAARKYLPDRVNGKYILYVEDPFPEDNNE